MSKLTDTVYIVSLGLDFNATLTMHSKNIGLIGQQVDAMSIVLDGAINGQANNSATLSTKLQAIESHLVEDRIIGTSLAVVAIVLTLAGFIHLRGRGRERGVENEHELGRGVGR